jgi:signal transduction histidine kinase
MTGQSAKAQKITENSLQHNTVNSSHNMDFSTVIASSVHDMKNSLSMLLNSLEEIHSDCSQNGCETDKFSQLQYEGQRLNNHLIQLLSIYRLDQASWPVNIQEIEVEDFLEECVLQYQTLLAPKGIEISAISQNDLTGYFDRDLVAGVVNNVVNNAYRYSKDKIHLNAKRENGFLVISIEDNGSGYPPSMILDASQGFSGIDFKTGSTGLGLYFSSLVAQSHQSQGECGYIKCSNDGIDGGGKFSIYLP